MRALTVELARMWHRRAVGLLVVLGLLGVLTVLGLAIGGAVPPSAADRAAAQQQADQQAQDPAMQQQLKDCKAAQQKAPEQGDQGDSDDTEGSVGQGAFPSGIDCEDMMPTADQFLRWSPPDYVSDYHLHLQGITTLLALALALAGITFAGADWNHGTFGTQLLYQPRRGIVFTSKAVALAIIAAVVGAIGAALAWIESYVAAAKWGTTELVDEVRHYVVTSTGSSMRSEQVPTSNLDLFGEAVRATSVVMLAALGGYLLVMIFRSSLAAIGILAAYGIVGETIVGNIFHAAAPYLLVSRLRAWMDGPFQLVQYPNGSCMGPSGCAPTVTTISVTAGGVYLAIVLAIGLTIAAWTFARRDVN